jgi:hypothetical protein
MSFAYTDTFKPVKPRKQRGTRSPRQLLDDTTVALRADGALDFPDAHADDIHAFFGSDGEAAERALCLGLGSQSSASPARAQLTLLLGVCDALQIVSLSVLRVYEILSSLIRIAPGSYYTTPSSLPLTTIC